MSFRWWVMAALSIGAPAMAQDAAEDELAIEVGRSDFVFVSDLAQQGFAPFGLSNVAQATFGMSDGTDIYMCFLADTAALATERQSVVRDHLFGDSSETELPNVPVICVLTQ